MGRNDLPASFSHSLNASGPFPAGIDDVIGHGLAIESMEHDLLAMGTSVAVMVEEEMDSTSAFTRSIPCAASV